MPEEEEESNNGYASNQFGQYNTNGSAKEALNTSLNSVHSATKGILSDDINADELEVIASRFDNIREMRRKNPKMKGNDDQALGDEFDDLLTQMITSLTEELQQLSKPNQALERGRAVI